MAGMGRAHWAVIAAGALLTAVSSMITWRYIRTMDRNLLALPSRPGKRKMVWREYSSQHDMVGRMLLPSLPKGAEQEVTPVLAHPLRDHTLYFSSDGVLVRQLAADLLQDIGGPARPFRVTGEWQTKISDHTQALRKQHDRRRMFHGLLMLVTAIVVLLPRVLHGATLMGAVANTWLPLGVSIVVLSGVFTSRGRKSLRQAILALDNVLRNGSAGASQVNLLPASRRALPTVALLLAAMLAAFGALWLTWIQRLMPGWRINHPGAGLVAGVAFLVVAAATASGYRVKMRWLLIPAGLVMIPPLTSQVPHPANVATWEVAPGLLSSTFIVLLVGIAATALTRSSLVSLPSR
ncbi:hypothetical protein [Streptomyces rimosus]|uniref:hypothetical protein n=1 Tax=Streptomyces rimosus TaxID=1927 RepID=UPI001331BB77|nr:hypothetical protein [Streptomyces rimosus]